MEIKTQEQLKAELSAPLPREAVKDHPTKANMSTIKAIYVTERLNDVFGIGGWRIKTDLQSDVTIEKKTTSTGKARTEYTSLMKTILEVPAYGIYYECVAGSTNDDEGDSAKGGTTDGITKICSWLGIGIEVFKGKVPVGNKTPTSTPAQPPAKPNPAPAAKPIAKQTNPQPTVTPEPITGAIQPNTNFDKTDSKEDVDARKKALAAYNKLVASEVLRFLITEKKLTYPTIGEFVEKHNLADVRAFYTEFTAKPVTK